MEFRPGAFGMNAINAVPLDAYVQGVVPVESPASWPIEALKAQAVAARSYAITNSKGGNGFEHYPDTRSQVYGGIGVEMASTNRAVAETANQVVTYQGKPVDHLLLLHLRRAHRERRELAGRHAAAVAELRRGPLRRRLPAPPLAPQDDPRRRRSAAERPGQGLVPRHQGHQARRLAAGRGRRRDRHRAGAPASAAPPCAPASASTTRGRSTPRSPPRRRRRRRRRRSRRRRSPRPARAPAASRRAPA